MLEHMATAPQIAAAARPLRRENFPVASLLFPRALRPHLRTLYGYARLVDNLGDELPPDERPAALDELERELDACYAGTPSWPAMVELQATIREFSLPREPFERLLEANRIDQRVTEYATWTELLDYCSYSANPCGRLVLGLLRRSDERKLQGASDDVCTALQLVNFIQDVPRDLALGRVYLPAEDRDAFGVTVLDRPNEPLRRLLEFEANRARALLVAGATLERLIGGRMGRAVALFARGGVAAADALERARFDVFSARPSPSRTRLAREALTVLVR